MIRACARACLCALQSMRVAMERAGDFTTPYLILHGTGAFVWVKEGGGKARGREGGREGGGRGGSKREQEGARGRGSGGLPLCGELLVLVCVDWGRATPEQKP